MISLFSTMNQTVHLNNIIPTKKYDKLPIKEILSGKGSNEFFLAKKFKNIMRTFSLEEQKNGRIISHTRNKCSMNMNSINSSKDDNLILKMANKPKLEKQRTTLINLYSTKILSNSTRNIFLKSSGLLHNTIGSNQLNILSPCNTTSKSSSKSSNFPINIQVTTKVNELKKYYNHRIEKNSNHIQISKLKPISKNESNLKVLKSYSDIYLNSLQEFLYSCEPHLKNDLKIVLSGINTIIKRLNEIINSNISTKTAKEIELDKVNASLNLKFLEACQRIQDFENKIRKKNEEIRLIENKIRQNNKNKFKEISLKIA